MAFHIACQTITFGQNQWERFPEVFAAVKKTGYAGIETGYRHLVHHPAAEIRKMLNDAGLELVGTHLGGNLEDAAQAESEKAIIDEVLDYIGEIGTTRIIYSGLKYQDDDQFARDLDMVSRTAEKCRERGVSLLYHNHWYEFSDNWRGMNGIIERGSDAIGFCPDMGWVHKGGADCIEFLNKVNGRLGAIHFKDFLTLEGEKDFCILGDGVTPFNDIVNWMRKNAPNLWVIAEQDKTDVPVEETVLKNAEYLKEVLG